MGKKKRSAHVLAQLLQHLTHKQIAHFDATYRRWDKEFLRLHRDDPKKRKKKKAKRKRPATNSAIDTLPTLSDEEFFAAVDRYVAQPYT